MGKVSAAALATALVLGAQALPAQTGPGGWDPLAGTLDSITGPTWGEGGWAFRGRWSRRIVVYADVMARTDHLVLVVQAQEGSYDVRAWRVGWPGKPAAAPCRSSHWTVRMGDGLWPLMQALDAAPITVPAEVGGGSDGQPTSLEEVRGLRYLRLWTNLAFEPEDDPFWKAVRSLVQAADAKVPPPAQPRGSSRRRRPGTSTVTR